MRVRESSRKTRMSGRGEGRVKGVGYQENAAILFLMAMGQSTCPRIEVSCCYTLSSSMESIRTLSITCVSTNHAPSLILVCRYLFDPIISGT